MTDSPRVRPDDMKDWTVEDWEAEEEEYATWKAQYREEVYAGLCFAGQLGAEWRLSGERGVEEVAFYSTDDEGRKALSERWRREGEGEDDPAWQARMWEASSVLSHTQSALEELIAEGRVELFVKDNWPALRIVAGYQALAEHLQDRWVDLAARQQGYAEMPYEEYLASDEWKRKRVVVLERSGHRCQICDRPPTPGRSLHVHHRSYVRRGNESYNDLTVLCADCHEMFHRHRRVR